MSKNTLNVAKRKTAERREERRNHKAADRKALNTAILDREDERSNRFYVLAGRDPKSKREFATHKEFIDAVDELGELTDAEEHLRSVTNSAYKGEPSLMEQLYGNDPFYTEVAEQILQPAA